METLYRKYRPIDFDTVVGQDAIVKTLRNQIVTGSIAHAYLFSGTRGTGKTTVAKIFARAINCPNENKGNPCNECEVCKSALVGVDYNILELDAASNGNVEKVRQITDSMQYRPINNEKYKVYIIDEAHALTGYSKEAFLKSLEEPPEYVVYILATTDPNKLPETVLSRCQKYNFKRISIDLIVDYLKGICQKEKIEIDEDALIFIAEKSDGSMRESLSQLDRVRAYANNDKLTIEDVVDILGIVDDEEFRKITKAVNEGDIEVALTILSDCLEKGKDITRFTNDLIWHLRNILIAKDITEPIETLNITKTNFDKLKKEAEAISKDVLIYFIEELSRTSNLMKYDENRRVILETALIRLATPETSILESAIMARLDNLEKMQKEGFTYKKIEDNKEIIEDNTKENKEVVKELKLNEVTMDEIKKVTENWKTIASSLNKVYKNAMISCKPVPGSEKEPGYIHVMADEKKTSFIKRLGSIKEIEDELTKSSEKLIGKKIKYKIILFDDKDYAENITWSLDKAREFIDTDIGEEE